MSIVETIVEFIKKNKELVVILLILVIGIIYGFSHNIEGFENNEIQEHKCPPCPECPVCPSLEKQSAFKRLYADTGKFLNFKCKIEDKTYYLCLVKNKDCAGFAEHRECLFDIPVLLEESKIVNDINQYKMQVKTAEEMCNFEEYLKCKNEGATSNGSSEEINYEEACKKKYDGCAIRQRYINDFTVISVEKKKETDKDHYIISGSAQPQLKDASLERALSQNLMINNNLNYLCADLEKNPTEFVNMSIIETDTGSMGSVIGDNNGSGLKIKLQFETPIIINGVKLYNEDGSPRTQAKYVGICKDKICRMEDIEYKRLCLLDDITDSNVVEFEPMHSTIQ